MENNKTKSMKFKIQSIMNKLNNVVGYIYGLMIVAIILICIIFRHIRFGRDSYNEYYLPTIILIVCGCVFLCGLTYICSKILDKFSGKRKFNYWIIIFIFTFFAQIWAVKNYYFYTDWDVQTIIGVTNNIVHNIPTDEYNSYFSMYPNNLFLVSIFTGITRLAHILGLHKHEYFVILCVQCLLNTLTGALLVNIIKKLFSNRIITVIGFTIYLFLIGMSPWVSIPYSDSIGLIFPILIISIYIDRDKFKYWAWLGISFLSYIGYKIKPQVLIVFIAIMIITCINFNFEDYKRKIINILATISGIICAIILSGLIIGSLHMHIDNEKTFGLKHFFMMGMNEEDMGVWSAGDVDYSLSFSTKEERDEADLNLALDRIKKMGLFGFSKQMIRKTLTNYCDGTFCWGGEGVFYSGVIDRNTSTSRFVRSLYYNRDYSFVGKYNNVWSNFVQMIWVTSLTLSAFSVLHNKNKNITVIMLAIIGLTIFEMIFEARARYLFIYSPFYIVLALCGIFYFMNRGKEKLER